jgi:hypothetical protein
MRALPVLLQKSGSLPLDHDLLNVFENRFAFGQI